MEFNTFLPRKGTPCLKSFESAPSVTVTAFVCCRQDVFVKRMAVRMEGNLYGGGGKC